MENIIILVVVLAFIGYIDYQRNRAESQRFKDFANNIKVEAKPEPEINLPLPEEEVKDEIIELDEVSPDQLIKELKNEDHED